MPIIQLILILAAIGILMWLLNNYGAQYMDAKYVKLINIVVFVCTILWILSLFFDLGSMGTIGTHRVGR